MEKTEYKKGSNIKFNNVDVCKKGELYGERIKENQFLCHKS